jgi:coniferyl-aldehyde dehydrogenase
MSTAKVVSMTEPSNDVQAAYERLRRAYRNEPYPTAEVREDRLDRLLKVVQRERDAMVEAISKDFGNRNPVETLVADVLLSAAGARHARSNVRSWMKRRHVDPEWWSLPARTWVDPMPVGVVAIIAPWNYPVSLCLGPLASALAAGNRALIKPSELTPLTSALIAKLMRETFTPDEVAVVEGGPEVAKAVTQLPVDHLCFTGSVPVGKLVARAAAENLVPTTLELGGKSPALLHADYSMETFAKKIAQGKIFNAAQTCIAPDYVLVPEGSEQRFGEAFKVAVRKFMPDLQAVTVTSVSSDRGWQRFTALLEDAKAKGAKVEETLGAPSPSDRRSAPVLVFGVNESMRVMQEELFCPILPVKPYKTIDEAIGYINEHPRPLAFYYFDDDASRADDVLRRTISGSAAVNDTLHQFAQENLGFGGVGNSGMGSLHGHAGFEAFSHRRSVFDQSRFAVSPSILSAALAVASRAVNTIIGGRGRKPGE